MSNANIFKVSLTSISVHSNYSMVKIWKRLWLWLIKGQILTAGLSQDWNSSLPHVWCVHTHSSSRLSTSLAVVVALWCGDSINMLIIFGDTGLFYCTFATLFPDTQDHYACEIQQYSGFQRPGLKHKGQKISHLHKAQYSDLIYQTAC